MMLLQLIIDRSNRVEPVASPPAERFCRQKGLCTGGDQVAGRVHQVPLPNLNVIANYLLTFTAL